MRLKRLLICLICCLLLVNTTAYADNVGGSLPESELSELKQSIGITTEGQWELFCTIWSVLSPKYGDYVAAAVLANIKQECSFNAGTVESSTGNGVGIIQWSFGRRKAFSEWCKENNKNTVKEVQGAISDGNGGWLTDGSYVTYIGDLAAQAEYIIIEMETQGQYTQNYEPSAYGGSSGDYANLYPMEEWLKSTDVVAMAVNFCSHYERCNLKEDIYSTRGAFAEICYKLGTGTDISEGVNQSTSNQIMQNLISQGLYSEGEFVKWKKMTESVLEFGDIADLTDDEISDIANWKGDMEYTNSENFLVKLGRLVTMIAGIIFLIWVVFIYLFYWFDRINNFIELDLLKMVTFGKLTISPDESECTFSLKDIGKTGTRTINHKKIIGVCIIGVGFAVFIISGTMYNLLNKFVLSILKFLN